MSRPPNSLFTWPISFSAASCSRKSMMAVAARAPDFLMAAALSSSAARSRPVSITSQPSPASASAMPRPIPRLDPVTSAILPFSPKSMESVSSIIAELSRATGRVHLFKLQSELLHQCRPLGLLARDIAGVFLRRARGGIGTVLDQTFFHLVGRKDRAQLFVQPLHD